MKLMRFGEAGAERPGVELCDGTRIDASALARDWDERFFDGDGIERLRCWVREHGAEAPRVGPDVRLGPAVARPSKLVCIGLNFADHVRESGAQMPSEPVVFMKATSAWSGPFDDVRIPKGSTKTDWEVELAFVVGRRAAGVSEGEALAHIAGFGILDDYSEREWQLERGGQWVKGKSADTFAPFGPYLVTPDEVGDAGDLRLWLEVNGVRRQDSRTSKMIFGVARLLSYLSGFMTLSPGDVVSTGTPPGVGLGMDPPRYLAAGDVVECGVDGLGFQRQRVVGA